MRLPRLSIAGLMAVVGLVALAVAALRSPSALWVNVSYSLALAILVAAVLGVIYCRGRRRAFWVGFAVAGWGYFLAALGPHSESLGGPYLVTTALLDILYAEIAPTELPPDLPPPPPVSPPALAPSAVQPGPPSVIPAVGMMGPPGAAQPILQQPIVLAGGFIGPGMLGGADAPPLRPWSVWTEPDRNTGAMVPSNYITLTSTDHFRWIGHSLFTLIVGYAGGMVARRFYTTRDQE